MQDHTHFFPITYSATDVAIYQQDVVIHRSEGASYEEPVGDLNVWHVYVGDRCKSDYGDIRFTDASGNALAYYLWPDYDSSSARFCVRLVGADQSGALVIWYGNPTATTTSDGDAVYLFFDQFDGEALDSEKWAQVGGGTITISGGAVTIAGDGSIRKHLRSQVTVSDTMMVQCRGRATTISHGHYGPYISYCWDGTLAEYGEVKNGYYIADRTSVPDCINAQRVNGVRTFTSMAITPDTAYHLYSIHRAGPNINISRDGETLSRESTAFSSGYIGLSSTEIVNSPGVYDWVLVRVYSATPPAATAFGPEQASGTLHHVRGVVFGSANMMVI